MALLFHCYDEHIWPYFQIFNTLVEKLGLQPLLPWLQIEKSNNQPSCQNKCWQCRLLQTKNAETFLFFIFQLHTQFSIFCFDNTDDTLNGLVRLRHNNHLVRNRQRSCFGLLSSVATPGWKLSGCPIKNIQWFYTLLDQCCKYMPSSGF